MNNDNNNESINKILQDFTYIYLLILIAINMDNEEYTQLLDYLCVFLLSIFGSELVKSSIIDVSSFSKSDIASINKIRTLYLKDEPKKSSKLISQLNNQTGINLKTSTFDIVITKDLLTNKLVSINYPYFLYSSIPDDIKDVMDTVQRFPVTVLKIAFDALEINFEKINNELQEIAKQGVALIKSKIKLKRYSYSSVDLFKKTNLTDSEKYFVLYRYPLVSLAQLLPVFQPIQIITEKDSFPYINTSFTESKIKSIVIETIYRDHNHLDLQLTNDFTARINSIPQNFYPLNRKLRNNIHYTSIDVISDNDYDLIIQHQNTYLKTLLDTMAKHLNITIKPYNRFFTLISKLMK